MEPFRWADLAGLANTVVAVVAVIAALLAPRIAWRLNQRSQEDAAKRNTKLWIFGQLMEHRHTSQSREAVRAFNLIDIAFHDEPEVRNAWREYHSMISNRAFFNSDVGIEMVGQKRTELLSMMAKHLGYNIDRFDVERMYTPTWLAEEEELQGRERVLRLAALRAGINTTHSEPTAPKVNGQPFVARIEDGADNTSHPPSISSITLRS